MDLEYKGANCVVIISKKDIFVTDPKLSDVGLKDQGSQATAVLLTQAAFDAPVADNTLKIDRPGEYEISNCSVRGVAARRHSELTDNLLNSTIYRLDIEGLSVAILGHIDPNLSEDQLETLGVIDILVIPVGNGGYTIDPKSAVDLIRKIDPKVVVPTHYAEEGINYEVPQLSLDEFVKELGATIEETPKLRLKAGVLPPILTVYKIVRTK